MHLAVSGQRSAVSLKKENKEDKRHLAFSGQPNERE